MDFLFEQRWTQTLNDLSDQFGQPVDLQAALFLIGVQELGQGYRTYKKDEKVQLIHVALCTLLQPFGYYELVGRDEDGWPHFKRNGLLPSLIAEEQERLVKKAIVEYFSGLEE
jgi:hypothetical protein